VNIGSFFSAGGRVPGVGPVHVGSFVHVTSAYDERITKNDKKRLLGLYTATTIYNKCRRHRRKHDHKELVLYDSTTINKKSELTRN